MWQWPERLRYGQVATLILIRLYKHADAGR